MDNFRGRLFAIRIGLTQTTMSEAARIERAHKRLQELMRDLDEENAAELSMQAAALKRIKAIAGEFV